MIGTPEGRETTMKNWDLQSAIKAARKQEQINEEAIAEIRRIIANSDCDQIRSAILRAYQKMEKEPPSGENLEALVEYFYRETNG